MVASAEERGMNDAVLLASDPAVGLGRGQCRVGQDLYARHPGGAAAAGRRQPEKILCLTYTKAAAAEMQGRPVRTARPLGDDGR